MLEALKIDYLYTWMHNKNLIFIIEEIDHTRKIVTYKYINNGGRRYKNSWSFRDITSVKEIGNNIKLIKILYEV